MQRVLLVMLLVACGDGSSRPPPAAKPAPAVAVAPAKVEWQVPTGWRRETIAFPLDFAKTLQHSGVEELRFPKGFFDPASPEYWSYAFVWRTTDPALLDAAALSRELTDYFRGLIAAVDEKKQQVKDRDKIVAVAHAAGSRFELKAEVFDAFGKGQPVSLVGWAERHACGSGALWIFVLAPPTTSIRAQLDELARDATKTCVPAGSAS